MSLNLIFTPSETLTSLITLRLKQLGTRHQKPYYFIWHVCVCLWVGSYVSDISATVIGRSTHMSNVVIILARLWFESAKLALIPNCTVCAVKAIDGNQPICDDASQYLLNSFWCVHCTEGIMRPPIHTQSLINVKSLHTGCQRAVGGAADEVGPTLAALWGDVLSVSVIYTTL